MDGHPAEEKEFLVTWISSHQNYFTATERYTLLCDIETKTTHRYETRHLLTVTGSAG
jgi:hypothetical protein